MKLDWSSRTINDWRTLLVKVPRANWMQSWPFAKALRVQDQKVTRLALIEVEGEAVGLMAVQEIKLGPIHLVNLHRGPLWFDSSPSESHLKDFSELFAETFPRRIFRRRRWLPEWENCESARKILSQSGFNDKNKTYQTIWLDLRESHAVLRAQLKQKWRNALSKGERSELEIKVDENCSRADLFLQKYQSHRMKKKYLGYSPRFLREEIAAALPFKDVILLWACRENIPIAGIMLLLHGNSATYRVGWTTNSGRNLNAHNVLLWEAVKVLKNRGLNYFDLGGIDTEKGAGLSQFKQGMGGKEVELMGVFS